MFTLDVQIRDVTMGDCANFICCAGGTNITTVYWEIEGRGSYYRNCNDPAFCVRNTSDVNSVCSTLEIDTTQLNRTQTIVGCIVEQTLGGQTSRNISTGQLTVRNVPRKLFHIYSPSTHIRTTCTHTHSHTHAHTHAHTHTYTHTQHTQHTHMHTHTSHHTWWMSLTQLNNIYFGLLLSGIPWLSLPTAAVVHEVLVPLLPGGQGLFRDRICD